MSEDDILRLVCNIPSDPMTLLDRVSIGLQAGR